MVTEPPTHVHCADEGYSMIAEVLLNLNKLTSHDDMGRYSINLMLECETGFLLALSARKDATEQDGAPTCLILQGS